MASEINLTAYGTYTQIITNAEPANNGLVVASAIDNSTPRDLYVDLELRAQFGTNPSAGGYFACYLVQALDGTNYGDGTDGSTVPPATAWVCNFPVRAVTSAQRVGARGIRIPPGVFRFVVQNLAGQTVTTDTMQLYYRSYSEEIN